MVNQKFNKSYKSISKKDKKRKDILVICRKEQLIKEI